MRPAAHRTVYLIDGHSAVDDGDGANQQHPNQRAVPTRSEHVERPSCAEDGLAEASEERDRLHGPFVAVRLLLHFLPVMDQERRENKQKQQHQEQKTKRKKKKKLKKKLFTTKRGKKSEKKLPRNM